MFDFLKGLKKKKPLPLYRTGWGSGTGGSFVSFDTSQYVNITSSLSSDSGQITGVAKEKNEDTRISKKPVEVYKEILSEEPFIDVSDIDAKIKMVENRIKVLRDDLGINVSDEPEALEFLKARKKLAKVGKKHGFGWATTTIALVNDLCKKYKLAYVDVQSYYKTMPLEAIEELEKYLKEYKKYTDIPPVIKLVIDDEPPKNVEGKDNERKKDPILLASSPFGKWFFVLGAWDKTVAVVDELIYEGK